MHQVVRYIRYGSIIHHERMYPMLSLSKHHHERLSKQQGIEGG